MSDLNYSCSPSIFQDLEPRDRESLARIGTPITCRKGKILYMPNETGETIFFLQKGSVQVYRISPEGKKLVIANLQPGSIFGEMALVGQHMHSSFAQALEDSVLCVIRREELERLLLEKPRIALQILQILGQRLAEAENKLEDMAFRSVSARLASLLLRLSDNGKDEIQGLSHQDLAEMIGSYRETVTQTLNQLKASQVVDVHRKRLRILRPERLAAMVGDGDRL